MIFSSLFSPLEEVGRHLVNGFIVSTVLTPDEGYETAVLGNEGNAYPIERHDCRKDAENYHYELCKEILHDESQLLSKTKLGWLGLTEEEHVLLTPMSDEIIAQLPPAELFVEERNN